LKVIELGDNGRVMERQEDPPSQAAKQARLEVVGFILKDENITQHDLAGKPILDLEDDSAM